MISKDINCSEYNPDLDYHPEVDSRSNILTEESFSLLEERLMIQMSQRKIGEIVIRKEIETQLVRVQVPIMREKLIVEQVSPEYKLLAEIDLGQPIDSSSAIANSISDPLMSANSDRKSSFTLLDPLPENIDRQVTPPTVYGSTDSLQAASELLSAIASLPRNDCGVIMIEIVLKNSKRQASY